jgi:transposase-like protein
MRKAVEVAFEMRTGGQQSLGAWLAQQHVQGKSLRDLSRALFEKTGVQVSHETIRAWIREG